MFPFIFNIILSFLSSSKGKAGARLSTDDDTVSHFFSCNDHDSILFATDKYVSDLYPTLSYFIPPTHNTHPDFLMFFI
jgi:DNA gyrase subunit A